MDEITEFTGDEQNLLSTLVERGLDVSIFRTGADQTRFRCRLRREQDMRTIPGTTVLEALANAVRETESERASDQQLLNALNVVLSKIVGRHWNTARSIAELRELIKHFVHVSDEIPGIPPWLVVLPEETLEFLIDRLDLQQKFPEAKAS